jgi:predicted Zn finger-like uncharacterized protein
MKVQCGQCPAKYAIADERIHGKRVRIRCKRCGAAIVVDGKVDPPSVTSEANPQASSDSVPPSSPRPEAKTILGGLEAPTHLFDRKPSHSSPPPRPVAARGAAGSPALDRTGMPATGRGFTEPPTALNGKASWRVAMTENDLRWMTTSDVVDAYRAGVLKPETFVLREGMSHWQTLLEVGELADAVGETVAPDLLDGKPAHETSDAPASVPPPRKPSASKRLALLDPEDSENLNVKMTKLGLGLNLDPQSSDGLDREDDEDAVGPVSERSRSRAAHVDESFLTLPFTDAESVESAPAPKVDLPDFAALPVQAPVVAEPELLATSPLASPAVPAPPTPGGLQADIPAFSAVSKTSSSGSLWPWLLALVLVGAAVAAAVVFSR